MLSEQEKKHLVLNLTRQALELNVPIQVFARVLANLSDIESQVAARVLSRTRTAVGQTVNYDAVRRDVIKNLLDLEL